jgi:hypothetical protein
MLAGNALVYYGEKQLRDELVAERSKAVPPRSGNRVPAGPVKDNSPPFPSAAAYLISLPGVARGRPISPRDT